MANAHSRTTLFDNGDFSLHAQLSPVSSPQGGHAFTITSQRQESRNPHEEHVRFFACLDREGLQNLQTMIASELARPSILEVVSEDGHQVFVGDLTDARISEN